MLPNSDRIFHSSKMKYATSLSDLGLSPIVKKNRIEKIEEDVDEKENQENSVILENGRMKISTPVHGF